MKTNLTEQEHQQVLDALRLLAKATPQDKRLLAYDMEGEDERVDVLKAIGGLREQLVDVVGNQLAEEVSYLRDSGINLLSDGSINAGRDSIDIALMAYADSLSLSLYEGDSKDPIPAENRVLASKAIERLGPINTHEDFKAAQQAIDNAILL